MRDALWERICLHLKHGRATLVYSTDGEQRLTFRVHNTPWQPVDLDGITLMRRPLPTAPAEGETLRPGFSKAAQRLIAQRTQAKRARANTDYVAIDLETTGLNPTTDSIIEYGAVKVEHGTPTQTFSVLIRQPSPLPPPVATLTGLDDTTLSRKGHPPEQALADFLAFLGKHPLIGYNVAFDFAFLRAACARHNQLPPTNPARGILPLARRKCPHLPDHRLETLARHFAIPITHPHRALDDALLTHLLYLKLNE